ncbi:MAG: sterol 14-demethylase [Halioglobus sp.]|jgi:sterol 14-demethylase
MAEQAAKNTKLPPKVSGASEEGGHIGEFSENFCTFLARAHAECGELAEFDMSGQETVLMSGPEAQELFFRTQDEVFSQAIAYQVMVPVFGPGVIFDAPPDRCKAQLKIQVDALRYQNMKNYASVIAKEVEDWIADWGDEGEKELLHEFHELTLHTATHCLLGADFRYSMTDEFFELYKHLQAGVQALSFVDPYMQQPLFAKRDESRERLEQIVSELIARRKSDGKEHVDALETFMTGTYPDGSHLSDTEVTGLIIATMFAGHHTSSGVAAETLVEIAKRPDYAAELVAELDELYSETEELSNNALRELPVMEGFLREVLRLHPPLVVLMRRVMEDVQYKDYLIPEGKTVAVSVYESHMNEEYFPEPLKFDPHREEPEQMFAYIPFGGGRHKCAGSAFALLQVKAIFSALLRKYEFQLVGPTEDYVDEVANMTIRPKDPCRIRYKRRTS